MPLADNALTSVEKVRSICQTEEEDTAIEDLINVCSITIENYCKRKFKEQTFTEEEYDGTGTRYLLLLQYPVKSMDLVSVNDVILDPSKYKIKKSNGTLIRVKDRWPKDDLNVLVTYTAGYLEIPADLEYACRYFVSSMIKSDISAYSTTFQEGFVFKTDAIPVQVKLMLQAYVRVV